MPVLRTREEQVGPGQPADPYLCDQACARIGHGTNRVRRHSGFVNLVLQHWQLNMGTRSRRLTHFDLFPGQNRNLTEEQTLIQLGIARAEHFAGDGGDVEGSTGHVGRGAGNAAIVDGDGIGVAE